MGEDAGRLTLADQAEADARLLRDLASAHLPSEFEPEPGASAK